jgi:type III pantothenate kinase
MDRMYLLIDIGNTACKAAFADDEKIGKVFRYAGDDIRQFIRETCESEYPGQKAQVAVLSNVRADDPELETMLRNEFCDRLVVLDVAECDRLVETGLAQFEVLANMPEGMGADRIAAILAANNLFPENDLMVFDFGTATTVEFINCHKENSPAHYMGGSISLGLNTRYRALSYFAERIPLLNPRDFMESHKDEKICPYGTDLDTAMAAGNILGIMFEIEGYQREYPERTVIFTGGDAIYFAERLKSSIFVVYNLVLMGLSQIAQFYAEQ